MLKVPTQFKQQERGHFTKTCWREFSTLECGKAWMLPKLQGRSLHYVGIDPGSRYAFIEVRDQATKRTAGVKLYDLAKKGFIDVNLDLGNELGAK